MDKGQPLQAGARIHCGVYESDDGGNKGDRSEVLKRGARDYFLFDSWFASKKEAEAAMELGADLIGMVKTNTKGFCKPMVPGGRPLIAIGYKYNARKVLYFIVTDNAGSTKTGIPYLPKYPDQFTNVAIHPVARPLLYVQVLGAVLRSTRLVIPRLAVPRLG